jgi:hypothetical protein
LNWEDVLALQVFAPFSPLNFEDSFPNKAPNDCPSRGPMNTFLLGGSANNLADRCIGDPDQKGHYRDPYIVGLKVGCWLVADIVRPYMGTMFEIFWKV